MSEAAPWREGRLIVTADRALAERRVNANFPARDSDAALAPLSATLGFRQTASISHLITLH